MTVALCYSAPNPKGSSALIAAKLKDELSFSVDCVNIKGDGFRAESIEAYNAIVFIVATYGDQELQDDFEKFLLSIGSFFNNKKFSICEIGNYYGYEDFTTGAGAIVQTHLVGSGGVMIMPIASIDTLPLIDWNEVEWWIGQLNKTFSKPI